VLEAEVYFVILKGPPPLNDSDQDYNDGDDQQDMNEITHRIATHQPQKPQNDQYYRNRPQHFYPPFSLLPKDLLDLTDLFLNFAGCLFTGAFGFQLWIIAQITDNLLDLTLYFVKRTFRLVLRTGFHGVPPFAYFTIRSFFMDLTL
jgi:hypothetical protein